MKAVESPPLVSGASVWPMSVAAYRALGEAGLIPKDTELLYGLVYKKMSKSPYHSFLVQLLHDALLRMLPPGFILRTEQPIACDDSEPEPDLAVVKGRKEDFRDKHPHSAELVIEVCISSHDYDRSKLRAYARANVQECWLVLCPERQIEVHRQPTRDRFAERMVIGPDGSIVCAAVPQINVELKTLFAG